MDECKYCKPISPKTLLAKKEDYISAWVKIFTNKEDVRLGLSARGETDINNSVQIYYCPICGRKFE
jgi:hypothetical protein